MTRFMQPGQISPFLESLSKAQKIAVLQNSEAASLLSMEEISKIESTARHELSQLPSVHYERKEVSFWSTVMSHTEDQDQFLADFHRTHPELYPILAQLRFKLEDIPTLEESLVQKVLGELNNDQLAKAFLRSSPELIAYVLGQLRENRRQLVSSQMTTLQRLPENQLKEAERDLAARFRKARV